MNQQDANKIIDKTRDDYNLIADQFASTRKFNWGDFAEALRSLPIKKGAKVLDLGCGNGRVYELLKDLGVDYYGLDLSKELISHAKQNVPDGHFTVGDMKKTPYKDGEFDVVISVATIHHIPSKELRKAVFNEIYRITKPKGHVLITAWYFWNKPKYIKQIAKTALERVFGRTNLDIGDFMMTWKESSGNTITNRYFHAWRKHEFRKYLGRTGFRNIHLGFYKKRNQVGRNIIATCQK